MEDVPDWFNFDQIQRGIEVFLAYLPVAGCTLFYRLLVGGLSIPKIVKVLTVTQYLVPTSSMTTTTTSDDGNGFLACCFTLLSSSADNSDTVEVVATTAASGGHG